MGPDPLHSHGMAHLFGHPGGRLTHEARYINANSNFCMKIRYCSTRNGTSCAAARYVVPALGASRSEQRHVRGEHGMRVSAPWERAQDETEGQAQGAAGISRTTASIVGYPGSI